MPHPAFSFDVVDIEYAAYLRVSSMAIAGYDWLDTLPTEWQMLREQPSVIHLTRPFVLFLLIRYTSMATLILSNITFFEHIYSFQECEGLMYALPVLKALQSAISQIILSDRTWAISGRSPVAGWLLAVGLLSSITLEFWCNVYERVVILGPEGGWHCTSGNRSNMKVAWIHYLVCMLFDLLCMVIATAWLYLANRQASRMSELVGILFREGLLYFAALTAANLVNLAFHYLEGVWKQSAADSLGVAITWVVTQRIIIHLRELRFDRQGLFNDSHSFTGSHWGANGGVDTDELPKIFNTTHISLYGDILGQMFSGSSTWAGTAVAPTTHHDNVEQPLASVVPPHQSMEVESLSHSG